MSEEVVVFEMVRPRRAGFYVAQEDAGFWVIHETWFATRDEAYGAARAADLRGLWYVAQVTGDMATVSRAK